MERQQGVASPPVTIHFNAYALTQWFYFPYRLGYQRENLKAASCNRHLHPILAIILPISRKARPLIDAYKSNVFRAPEERGFK